MKKLFVKIFIILSSSLLVSMYIGGLSEKNFFSACSGITFLVLVLTMLLKAIKKPRTNFSLMKSLCILTMLFIPFYVFAFNYLTIPSLIILTYLDIIGNYKEFLYKIYKRESKRIKIVKRQEERKRENEIFKNQLRNLYHEKNGRRLYITDI